MSSMFFLGCDKYATMFPNFKSFLIKQDEQSFYAFFFFTVHISYKSYLV